MEHRNLAMVEERDCSAFVDEITRVEKLAGRYDRPAEILHKLIVDRKAIEPRLATSLRRCHRRPP